VQQVLLEQVRGRQLVQSIVFVYEVRCRESCTPRNAAKCLSLACKLCLRNATLLNGRSSLSISDDPVLHRSSQTRFFGKSTHRDGAHCAREVNACINPVLVRENISPTGPLRPAFWSRQSLDAEVRFLRRQLALYVERALKPRRIDGATRVSLALLSRLFAWRSAGVVARPQTLIRWHRVGFRLLRGANVLGIGREIARPDATVLR